MNPIKWFLNTGLIALTLSSSNPLMASDTMVIAADRLLDVKSGKLISPAHIVVQGEKIEAINPETLPENVDIIELGDMTLLPGLIDMHTHITQEMSPGWRHAAVTRTPAEAALKGANNAKKTLKAGFTSIRDLGANGFSDIAVMKAIDNGTIVGPDIFPAAHAVGITGGHCDKTGFSPQIAETTPEDGVANGSSEILKAIRYQIKHGAKVIKICATAGVMSRGRSVGAQQYSQGELETVVAEAKRQGVKVAAHAHGTKGILAAVDAGVDSIEHGTIMNDEIARKMKKKGTYLVPTVYLLQTFDLSSVPADIRAKATIVGREAYSGLKLAIQENVPIAYGSDASVFPHGDNGKQFAVLVKYGMSPLNAIRSATLNAADLLGTPDRGQISSGFKADIIAVAGNPLDKVETLEDVKFVMKSGKVFHTTH